MSAPRCQLKPACLSLSVSFLLCWIWACSGDQSSKAEDHPKIKEIGLALFRARTMPELIPPPSQKHGLSSLEQAYLVQDRLAEALINVVGPVKGYKVGFASESVFEKFGISEPAYGRLYVDQFVDNGDTLSVDDFFVFTVEAEVAFKVGKRMDKEFQDMDELKEYVQSVHAALDISNSWYDQAAGNQTVADFVANSGGSHYAALGPPLDRNEVNLDNLTLKVLRNGKIVYEGRSTEALGSPWNVLKWIANHTFRRGYPLEPGFVILTGKVAAEFKASGELAKGEYVGDCGALGAARVIVH